MIMGRQYTNTVEFVDANANLRHRKLIVKF